MVDNYYISRANAVQCARDVANDFKNDGFVAEAGGADTVGDWLQDFPAADVRPVKRGHWVKRMEEHTAVEYTSFTPIWSCSECGLEYDPALAPRIHFCYNCGADMREKS